MADWWAKRPDNWEIWVSDDPAMTPASGAVMVTQGVGEQHPWVCENGESCADESVPDACCPNGREQPQDIVNVGQYWPRFDDQEFAGQSGRYWYYVVKNTKDVNVCLLFEVELFGSECTR